ncbi:hypothetical protein FHW69_000690 [Luteibacter sp. Sphag1AF]|uniref:DUF4381 domain-containing protein n=1 Tax=Luteibacter sp. Sphag1AF TaxID=2587031 RepID=UPI001617E4EE|nr:DUF4381 domain-containing protein [Luteibacter sp. Sphag1AF]MBB3226100.1 hypothetical protein [Luteibacter sp. Sphag1AF]
MAPPKDGPVLRDIHVPDVSMWWPLAPGWWGLIVVVLALITFVVVVLVRRRRHRRWVHAALADLRDAQQRHAADGDTSAWVAKVSQLLRRIARRARPASVSERGAAWQRTLSELAPRMDVGRLAGLDEALYARQVRVDTDAIARDVETWAAQALKHPAPRRAATTEVPHGTA